MLWTGCLEANDASIPTVFCALPAYLLFNQIEHDHVTLRFSGKFLFFKLWSGCPLFWILSPFFFKDCCEPLLHNYVLFMLIV